MPETQLRGNDRTWLLEQQESQRQEQRLVDEATHYQAMGIGLAALAQSFYATLMEPSAQTPLFTRDEALRLLEAALRGR